MNSRRLMGRPLRPTTAPYHICGVKGGIVHYSNFGRPTSATGQKHALPHCNSNGRCNSISGHTKSAQATISSENNALGLSMSDEQYELIALVVQRRGGQDWRLQYFGGRN
jgi:hypothetical protein